MVAATVIVLLLTLVVQLWRLEQILQSVCRNQVMTAKLLGQAHGIPVRDKK